METKVKYIPLGILIAFCCKSLVQGLSWESVSLSLILSSLWFLLEYKSEDKKLQALSLRIKELEEAKKINDSLLNDFRTSISSLRVSNGFKPTTVNRSISS